MGGPASTRAAGATSSLYELRRTRRWTRRRTSRPTATADGMYADGAQSARPQAFDWLENAIINVE